MRFARAVASLVCALAALAAACAPLSVEQERSLGADFTRSFQRRAELVRNPEVSRYVSAIGEKLAQQAGPQPFRYRFHVVAGNQVNAFAAPAGHIYLYAGILLKARNVSELAGVLAHEIGHVARRHVAASFNRALATNILRHVGAAAAELGAGPEAGRVAHDLGALAATGYLSSFSREAEHEADAFAVDLLFRSGYDPRGLADFFETLGKEGGRSAPRFLSSHPATADRIAHTRRMIAELPQGTPLQADDGGGLQRIQRLLRQPAAARSRRIEAAGVGRGITPARPGGAGTDAERSRP